MSDLCIVCGAPIPEGRQICPRCEKTTYIADSGDRTVFPTGAVRDMHRGKGRYDLIPWEAIHELALHCEAGALKYGERNVEKGIPISSLIDSAIRHLSKYMQGMDDEPHLRAALWNIAWAIWMEKRKPEMQDIPTRKGDIITCSWCKKPINDNAHVKEICGNCYHLECYNLLFRGVTNVQF